MTEFRLPDVGEGLESAEIIEWLVAEGQQVERDQPLVEILTDKSQTQLPSPQSGVIRRLGFAEGDIAEVGQVIVEFDGSPPRGQTQNPHRSQTPNKHKGRSPEGPRMLPVPKRRQLCGVVPWRLESTSAN